MLDIGYTEIFHKVTDEELRKIKETKDVKFYILKTNNYNFYEQRYIERETTYVVWKEEPYFKKLRENNPMEERLV